MLSCLPSPPPPYPLLPFPPHTDHTQFFYLTWLMFSQFPHLLPYSGVCLASHLYLSSLILNSSYLPLCLIHFTTPLSPLPVIYLTILNELSCLCLTSPTFLPMSHPLFSSHLPLISKSTHTPASDISSHVACCLTAFLLSLSSCLPATPFSVPPPFLHFC